MSDLQHSLCINCKVTVDSKHKFCPLCGIKVPNLGDKNLLSYCEIVKPKYKHYSHALTYKWLAIIMSVLVLVNLYQITNSSKISISLFWSSFVVLAYLMIAKVCLPIFYARLIAWQDSVKVLLLLSFLLILIDYQNGQLTWSIAYVLPSLALFVGSVCLIITLFVKSPSTNTIFLSLVMLTFNAILYVLNCILSLTCQWYTQTVLVSFIHLSCSLLILIYFILFKTHEYKLSTNAKLHT
jgi:hypothetical protein